MFIQKALRHLPAVRRRTGDQIRKISVHEYNAMDLFKQFKVKTPACKVASNPQEAAAATSALNVKDVVVKAQVLAGGRGKGRFGNGFQGGVHMAASAKEAEDLAANMIGQRLITKQTSADGVPCSKVLVMERMFLRKETYLAITMDRATGGPVIVASPRGGMNIEEVAAATPHLIHKEPVDIIEGIKEDQLDRVTNFLGWKVGTDQATQARENVKQLYELFIKKDCTLVEINPLGETHNGQVMACDGKVNFDENAFYRQPDIEAMIDRSQFAESESKASALGMSYVQLDGTIGCLVNGAGLAMATMDVLKLYGGEPANFLDVGGGATTQVVTEAIKLLDSDPKVNAILVNIFGGIMRCDVIAMGLITAASQIGLKKPLVVRLAGTNVEKARELIENSGLRMLTAEDLDKAAETAVKVSQIVKLAHDAQLGVSFELPL